MGHDRGGRVAYRMALDHPMSSSASGCSTSSRRSTSSSGWRRAPRSATGHGSSWRSRRLSPNASSAPRPSSSCGTSWAAGRRRLTRFRRTQPSATWRPSTSETLPGMCADYRASFHIDRQMDAEDRESGRRIESPVLVHWGDEEGAMSDSLETWGRWAVMERRSAAIRPLHPRRRPRGADRLARRILTG